MSELLPIEQQQMDLLGWLKTNHPEVFDEQKHLDAGSIERAYWHYGRWSGLKDAAELTRTPAPSASLPRNEDVQIEEPFAPNDDTVRVPSDMNPKGAYLDILREDDGDIVLTIFEHKHGLWQRTSMELCTGQGGGKHRDLWYAIAMFFKKMKGEEILEATPTHPRMTESNICPCCQMKNDCIGLDKKDGQ